MDCGGQNDFRRRRYSVLRIGVYASTITSELYFRQAVGRFVRVIPEIEEQSAAIYLPAETALIRHALHIKEEREHHLVEKINVEKASWISSIIGNAPSSPGAASEEDSINKTTICLNQKTNPF